MINDEHNPKSFCPFKHVEIVIFHTEEFLTTQNKQVSKEPNNPSSAESFRKTSSDFLKTLP